MQVGFRRSHSAWRVGRHAVPSRSGPSFRILPPWDFATSFDEQRRSRLLRHAAGELSLPPTSQWSRWPLGFYRTGEPEKNDPTTWRIRARTHRWPRPSRWRESPPTAQVRTNAQAAAAVAARFDLLSAVVAPPRRAHPEESVRPPCQGAKHAVSLSAASDGGALRDGYESRRVAITAPIRGPGGSARIGVARVSFRSVRCYGTVP
jgi:hypothetical protein